MNHTPPSADRTKFDLDIYFNVLSLGSLIALPLMILGRYFAGISGPKLVLIIFVSLFLNYLMIAVGILLFKPIFSRQSQSSIVSKSIPFIVYVLLIIGMVGAQYSFFQADKPISLYPWLNWIILFGMRGSFITGSIIFYFLKLQQKRQLEIEHRRVKVELLARTAELSQLKAQINPHFLFNTLTAISARSNEPDVDLMVEGLADVLRYNLRHTSDKDIFSKEVQAIRGYLSIQQLRFGNKIIIEIDVTPAASAAIVPQPILLPLVENAIKYGLNTTTWPLLIRVEARMTESSFIVSAENTGGWVEPKVPALPGQQIGLSNLRRRLDLIYGDRAKIFHESLPKTVRVQVELPLAAG